MSRSILASAILCGAVTLAPARVAAQSDDQYQIRSVALSQAEAWNRRDAKAYAALFTEDSDVVNVMGWWWKGRAEAERKLTQAFHFVFRDSRLTITDVHTRILRPDVALAHARWTMSGARTPPGMPEPREGIQTLTLQKQNGRWLIAALQNTLSIPERPFPAGPAEERRGTALDSAQPRPAVIGPKEGERRLLRGGTLLIKVDPVTTGSRRLVMATSDLPPGDTIKVHRHLREDEIVLITRGTAEVRLGSERHNAGTGGLIFIPQGTCIAMSNAGPDTLSIAVVFSSPGFEKVLRELSSAAGEPPKPITQEMRAAAYRHAHAEASPADC